jgi:hypothetical protein
MTRRIDDAKKNTEYPDFIESMNLNSDAEMSSSMKLYLKK